MAKVLERQNKADELFLEFESKRMKMEERMFEMEQKRQGEERERQEAERREEREMQLKLFSMLCGNYHHHPHPGFSSQPFPPSRATSPYQMPSYLHSNPSTSQFPLSSPSTSHPPTHDPTDTMYSENESPFFDNENDRI